MSEPHWTSSHQLPQSFVGPAGPQGDSVRWGVKCSSANNGDGTFTLTFDDDTFGFNWACRWDKCSIQIILTVIYLVNHGSLIINYETITLLILFMKLKLFILGPEEGIQEIFNLINGCVN